MRRGGDEGGVAAKPVCALAQKVPGRRPKISEARCRVSEVAAMARGRQGILQPVLGAPRFQFRGLFRSTSLFTSSHQSRRESLLGKQTERTTALGVLGGVVEAARFKVLVFDLETTPSNPL